MPRGAQSSRGPWRGRECWTSEVEAIVALASHQIASQVEYEEQIQELSGGQAGYLLQGVPQLYPLLGPRPAGP